MGDSGRSIDDLLAEMEPPNPPRPSGRSSRGGAPSPGGGRRRDRWLPIAGLLVVLSTAGIGFASGYLVRDGMRTAAAERTAATPEAQARQLRSAGWIEADAGVFVRRCGEDCLRPRIFGGGMAEVFQVQCLSRPCGRVRAQFVVLDGQGRVIDTLTASREGFQGERINLSVLTERPEARSIELDGLTARAIVH